MNKNVAILGGGHGAHAMAVDLMSRGFAVNMYEMPQFAQNLQKLFDTNTIESSGEIKGRFQLAKVTSDIGEAIEGVKYIFVVTPAFAHDDYAKLLKGKANGDQVVVVVPGAFAGLLFKMLFGNQDCPVIVELNNLPYDARVMEQCRVAIHGFNRVGIAFMPAEKGHGLIDEMSQFRPYAKVYSDVLEAGLSIVNPGVHTGPCLFSITAIENSAKHPFFLYEHGVTPSACKLNIQIDNERKAVSKKLGYHNATPIEDFSGMEEGFTWQDLYMRIHGNISLTPISGPHEIMSRYFTEDAPYGLVPWSSIGKVVGVETPVIDSIINIYNVVHERNWWDEGRTAKDLGLLGLTLAQIKEYVTSGNRPQ
ncbi:MAG TPA: NAD/NADP octopine/nopaline dehydrogenase family protein [Xanthobacteraceae bacterium]|nr:NAD/NADP octopine/nopaline dehydrogenase family protein [Xanthobacteraceae bacterium]